MALERELETFRARLPELMDKEAGRFVLIHGEEVAGVCDDKTQTLEEGYRRFGLEPFLVKRLVAHETPLFVPRGLV
jgi:hypothetical protein